MIDEKKYNDEIDYEIQSILKDLLKGKETNNRFYHCYSGLFQTSLKELSVSPDFDVTKIDKYNLDLYTKDGLYISKLDYTIDPSTCNIIKNPTSSIPNGPYYASIIEYQNHNLNLFCHYDRVGKGIDEPVTLIKIPYDETIVTDSPIYFDLYIDGVYISKATYDVITSPVHGKTVMFKEGYSFDYNSKIIFSFIATFTKHFEIKSVDYDTPITIKDCYRTDLVGTVWTPNGQILRLFENGKIIDSNNYHVAKGILSIKDETNYLTVGNTRTVSMRQYIVCHYSANGNIDKFNIEEFYVNVSKRVESPIPIFDYNEDKYDTLFFKSNGLYVNSAKYYIKDGNVVYYPHDAGLAEGDRLNFVITNKDTSVKEYTKFVECTEDKQMTLGIPVKYNPDTMMFLLFRAEGAYISNHKYNVNLEDNTIEFYRDMLIEAGDRFEFVFIEYKGINSTTAKALKRVDITKDNQTELKIPFTSYDEHKDSLILLRSDGMLIGNNRYTIDNEKKTITLLSGSPLYETMWVDFYINRQLERPYPVSYLNEIGGVI